MARAAKEAEGITARFDNTHLQPILRKQTNAPAYNEDIPRENLLRNTKTSANSIDFDNAVIVIKINATVENGRKTKVEVSFKGSSLRRIIQRQASGSVGLRRRERLS